MFLNENPSVNYDYASTDENKRRKVVAKRVLVFPSHKCYSYRCGVFEAHSCKCSADSGPQGEKENERFSKQQEKRYENTFLPQQPLHRTIRGGTKLCTI